MSQIIPYYLSLIFRGIVFILLISFITFLIQNRSMKITNPFRNIPVHIKRIYRLLRVNHRSQIVWNELIKLHRKENWNFGLYENERYIRTTFKDNNNELEFNYQVTDEKLILRAIIAVGFSEENITDIMILSSHLNNLLTFGMVRVNIDDNYVEFIYHGDLLTYMLYPVVIHSNIGRHFRITSDCYWAFSHMLNSGEEPVFVISELLKRNEEQNRD